MTNQSCIQQEVVGLLRQAVCQEQLLVDRYEFLVYRLVRHGLEAGHLFCRDSVSFRSLEDDLIDDERWKDKENLLAMSGLSHLNVPIHDHLAALEEQLEGRLKAVNSRILSGQNEAITFKNKKRDPNRRWSLAPPRAHETINHPFFDSLPHVDLSAVLHFANQRCGYLDAFKREQSKTGAEAVLSDGSIYPARIRIGRVGWFAE